MIKLKKILSVTMASLLTLTLAACSASKETAAATKQTLNFGAMASVDSVPIVIAEEKGFFKKEGVNVKLQAFKSARDRDAAFQSGSLDGIIGDQLAVSLYQNAGFDVKITGETDGDFILIAGANSGIKSLNDLKGKSTAISEKTAIEYTLDTILEKNNIEPKEIKKTIVPAIPTRLEMLKNNKVDAALLPEPFSTLALADGGILLGSAANLGSFSSVTAFSQKAIDAKASEIKAFYKAYNDAVDYINSTPIAEYEDIIIKAVGYPDSMKGKIKLPKFRKNVLPSDDQLKSVIDWATKNGLLKKTLTPKDLISDIGTK